ncbi:prophage CP4-57 regulatory family protein [Acinetobacter baumannii 1106579]|uniref:helix-turn-helix transcriptional regulator n=1 Tax=Acinetobacter baumannii TaxID=470 RepID=UPI00044BAD9C|nr:AlpA family phage regulatory protein [Acinetobacter baumannii]EXE17205.1 prophage CP4-57 regulatory family protein [Acinetobacter baumannii 1106579]
MEIDRRVRAKEFMMLMSIGRTKFYRMIKNGEIPQPIKVSEKEVFWHESSVKKVGGVSKSMLTLNEAIIDVKKG